MTGDIVVGTDRRVKLYSVGLFAETKRKNVVLDKLTGTTTPTQRQAIDKRKRIQTTPDMPVVHVTDLSKSAGDEVTIDMFGEAQGLPFMGDKTMEGQGQPVSFDTDVVKINQTRFPMAAGARMEQKRTKHNLRNIAKANMSKWFADLNDQTALVHLAGARGTDVSTDWKLPLDTHDEFKEMMINPVTPPTANRYYVAGGGDDVTSLGTTDPLKLEDLDAIIAKMRSDVYPIAPIKVENDPMGEEDPLYCLLLSEWQWHYIAAGDPKWRTYVAEAAKRSMISKHPLFRGNAAIWNGMVIRKMPRPIAFSAGDTVKKTGNNGTESSATVPANVPVHRALLVGGQALAIAEGSMGNGYDGPMSWTEVRMDHGNKLEIGGAKMDGMSKIRFNGSDGKLTDFGVAVIDSYAPDPTGSAGKTLRASLASD